jgi:hypothetical protein
MAHEICSIGEPANNPGVDFALEADMLGNALLTKFDEMRSVDPSAGARSTAPGS